MCQVCGQSRCVRGRLGALAAVLACVLAGASTPAGADVSVSPAYVEVGLDKGRPAGRFLIANLGDQEERFRVKALFFTYSRAGGMTQSETGENSLAEWIHFNPTELTIAPKTQRAVRFAIVPRGSLQLGEYWGAMELESLRTGEATGVDEGGRAVKIKLVATIMVPIFGSVGQVRYAGRIDPPRLIADGQGPAVQVIIGNTGTGRLGVRGQYELADTAGKVIAKGPAGAAYVMRGAERVMTHKVDANLPEGRYSIKVSYTATRLDKPLVREALVDWKPPPKPTTARSSGPSSRPTGEASTRPAGAPATGPAAAGAAVGAAGERLEPQRTRRARREENCFFVRSLALCPS